MPPLLLEAGDGTVSLVFVDGEDACAPMKIGKDSVTILKLIKAGIVSHPPGRM